jgi:hypothetical protein
MNSFDSFLLRDLPKGHPDKLDDGGRVFTTTITTNPGNTILKVKLFDYLKNVLDILF